MQVSDLNWRAAGLCAQTDPESFFPDKGESSAAAKAVCRRCPVTVECLAFALENDERFGVWGGTTETHRRRLRRGRRRREAGAGQLGAGDSAERAA